MQGFTAVARVRNAGNILRPSVLCLILLGAVLTFWMRPGPTPPAAAAPADSARASGFKITFGVKNRAHGRVWSGAVRNPAQIRSVEGWHFGSGDSIIRPNLWNITLETVGGDVAAKAVVLDLVSPEEQPVAVATRYGDFTFVPAQIAYGRPLAVEMFRGDVTVERVPIPQTATGREFEDDDPAILRTRGGEYWLAWAAYATRKRDAYQYTGADQIMIARSREGARWYGHTSLTPPGDHFCVALGEDARGRIWCVYGAQKRLESGDFDLYARRFDGRDWSPEERLTSNPLPDIFHRLAGDRKGNLYLVWMGYRAGPKGGAAQSDIFMRVFAGDQWGDEINVSQSPENDWEPAVAVDPSGRAGARAGHRSDPARGDRQEQPHRLHPNAGRRLRRRAARGVHLPRRGELRRHEHGADQPDPELGRSRNRHPSTSTRQGSLLLRSRDSTLQPRPPDEEGEIAWSSPIYLSQ